MDLICVDEDGFRPVNGREADALRFTFALEVGNWLINKIKVEYDPNLARKDYDGFVKGKVKGKINKTHISMKSEYNPENLKWLGLFIHEATHIWQRNAIRHREGVEERPRDYTYYYTQLPDLKLKSEEHADAVRHWFYVTYGITKGLAGGEKQMSREEVWERMLKAFGFDPADKPNLGEDVLKQLLEIWRPVIEEIRDPDHLPDTRAKAPNFP